jgi:TIR domain
MDWISGGLGYKITMYMRSLFKKYKYDVAISVAHEEVHIAQKIAASLKNLGITYFLYTEQRAQNWGGHILKISLDKYGAEAKYVMLIISKIYVEKYWANIENQISQIFAKRREVYILPLRLDNTPVDGLSKYIVFEKWYDNPDEIASFIADKLRLRNKIKTPVIIVIAVLLILGLVTYNLRIQNRDIANFKGSVEDSMAGFNNGITMGTKPITKNDSDKPKLVVNRIEGRGRTNQPNHIQNPPVIMDNTGYLNRNRVTILGAVFDEKNKLPVDSVTISINGAPVHIEKGQFSLIYSNVNINGFSITINITKAGYQPINENFTIEKIPEGNVINLNNFYLKK